MVEALLKTFVKPIHIPSIVSIIKALIEASSMCKERFDRAISFLGALSCREPASLS